MGRNTACTTNENAGASLEWLAHDTCSLVLDSGVRCFNLRATLKEHSAGLRYTLCFKLNPTVVLMQYRRHFMGYT